MGDDRDKLQLSASSIPAVKKWIQEKQTSPCWLLITLWTVMLTQSGLHGYKKTEALSDSTLEGTMSLGNL